MTKILRKSDMMAHAYNLSTLEAKARKLRLPNQFRLYIMFHTTRAMDIAEIMFQKTKQKATITAEKYWEKKACRPHRSSPKVKQMDPILNKKYSINCITFLKKKFKSHRNELSLTLSCSNTLCTLYMIMYIPTLSS